MFIVDKLPGMTPVALVVRTGTEVRLRTTCFRGKGNKLAGNFELWSSARELFSDKVILQSFLADIQEIWGMRSIDTYSVTLEYPTPVGWDSTAPLGNYAPEFLERFQPIWRWNGLRIKPTLSSILAPKTNLVTLIWECKEENGSPVVVVHSIYPGVDVGELEGDVTLREGRVFFDWSHPGEL